MALPPFQEFIDEHVEAIHRFLVAAVGPQEAEDGLQDTLIAALRGYKRLEPGSTRRAWGLSIARNNAIDAVRARGRRPLPISDPEPSAPAIAESDG